MKRKIVCLLLSAMMVGSVLSGCGKKDADTKAEEAMNNLGEAMENDDEEAAMAALGELDEIMQEEDMSSSEGEGTAYPADPRWADVKPGETAAQYYDLFIKSGMTVGEVREAIENSEEFFAFPYYGQEEISAETVGRDGTFYIEFMDANGDCYIKFDDEQVIRLARPNKLPGNEGDVYAYDDYPIVSVQMSGPSKYENFHCKHPEAYRTAFGTFEDITGMSSEDVENLKDTYFVGMDVELESERSTYEGRNLVKYTYTVPTGFSWNGYSMEELSVRYEFTVDYDTDKVVSWNFGHCQASKTWIAD